MEQCAYKKRAISGAYAGSICALWLMLQPGITIAADAWEVEGMNGILYIHGTLTESACRLEMDSARQDIMLGDTGTGKLLRAGDRGEPAGFQLRLRDCLRSSSVTDERTGKTVWAYEQPSVSVSFRAEKDADNAELISARGVSGMGLRIEDRSGQDIRLGSRGTPLLLEPGQNTLHYTVYPERTKAMLVAGSYYSVVDFNLSYN